ncbi:MAG: bestrophin family protein [Flavipsychrobacter sp.]
MRIYNPKNWFGILFQFHKSDTLRKLSILILIISIYTALLSYIELNYLTAKGQGYFSNLNQLHGLLGFALSILLVFRTNTAYDRWWEGRKQWGALVNTSRNLAIKLNSLLADDDTDNRRFFKNAIPLYSSVLKDHLQSEYTRYSLDEIEHPELKVIDGSRHAPNHVATRINNRINMLHKNGLITGEELLYINNDFTALTDICGACERIKNTPIPYSYSAFIKKFIFIYVMTLPLGYVFTLSYFVIPIVAIVFYVMASMELIAEEIEDPFGFDDNDLPMEKIAQNIDKHVKEIL